MSLADLVSKGETITLGSGDTGQTVEVFPLTVEDVGNLLNDYAGHMEGLLSGQIDPATIIKTSPLLAAAMIAYGTGNPTEVELARKLPLGYQIKIMQKLWEISAVDAESLGNAVSRFIQGVLIAAEHVQLENLLPTSSGGTPS